MTNKLHTLYENILDFAGFKVKDDGSLLITLNDKEFPADIEGKLMKFPYPETLKKFNPEKEVIFHPFQEFVNRGESDVVRKLRRVINVRLNLATLSMVDALMAILSSPAMHAKMNPQQRELIKSVDVVDEVLRGRFMSAAPVAFGESPDSLFLNIYTKKSGKFKGERHARVGVVSFIDLAEKPAVFQKIKDADWKKVLQILAFIFPGIDETESYNGFSDSTDCPWLDCLLRTSVNIAGRLNELWEIYGKFVDESVMLKFNMDWVEGIENLSSYKKEIMMIPSQRGNEGESETPAATQAPAMTINPSALNPAPAPVQQPTPAPVQVAPQMKPAPVEQKPIWGDAVQPLPPSIQQQQMPYGMQAPAPVAKKENGKISFDSIVQRPQSPSMMGMGAPFNPGMMQQQQGFPSPILQHQQNQQMMAYHAAMMNSPSMAAMVGYNPQMAQGYMPNTGLLNLNPQMHMQAQYMQQQQMPQLDPYGRPIMSNMIQNV